METELKKLEKSDHKHMLRLIDAHQHKHIPLFVVASVLGRSLRAIQYHSQMGYIRIHAGYGQTTMYHVTRKDFINYLRKYWKKNAEGKLVFNSKKK